LGVTKGRGSSEKNSEDTKGTQCWGTTPKRGKTRKKKRVLGGNEGPEKGAIAKKRIQLNKGTAGRQWISPVDIGWKKTRAVKKKGKT